MNKKWICWAGLIVLCAAPVLPAEVRDRCRHTAAEDFC